MKRAALSLMFSFAVAGSLYAAQDNPASAAPQAPAVVVTQGQDKAAPDVTIVGCLIQGSAPNVWVLENAKLATDPATAKGKSYVIQVTGNADLKPHLNHQVRIVGAEGSTVTVSAAPGSSSAPPTVTVTQEKEFPRFSARTVTMVANTCPA